MMTTENELPKFHRCFDDKCLQRKECRCYVERLDFPGPVAMTWRKGYECPSDPCDHFKELTQ